MIQQAVLNAAVNSPVTRNVTRFYGLRYALECVTLFDRDSAAGWVSNRFCDQVRKEYSLLASRYSEAA